MKKYICNIIIFTFFLSAIISSCKKDYVEPEFVTKSFGVYTSFFNHSNGGANVNPTYDETGKLEAMMDISQGFLSHEWSFWKEVEDESGKLSWSRIDSGVKFLRKNCGLSYGVITDYTPYLDNNLKLTNNQDNIIFYFEHGGNYMVKIKNAYDVPIEYMIHEADSVSTKDINRYYHSELLSNGTNMVERNYKFEVYDTLVVKGKIYSDISCTNEIIPADSLVSVNRGTTLFLRDATGTTKWDSGTSRIWNLSAISTMGGTISVHGIVTPQESTDSIASFTFPDKGKFSARLTVKRESTISSKFPEAERTKVLPFIIEVK